MEILALKNLTFCYPRSASPAVDDLSLSVNDGDFLVLCGRSGCGKTTLLRQLKPQLAPRGELSGEILFEGAPLSGLGERESAALIGFVQQSPENQIVTDKVWHELAFGLENLGYDTPTIRRRVAETASFFGIQNWFYRNVSELSGGQKQLLNLAAVMVMQPKILILDEPTSQLDPIAASDFLAVLKKINLELGTTIILTEHRLEEALPLSNRAAVMENGRLLCCGGAAEIGAFLRENDHDMFRAMPAAMRIWGAVGSGEKCPVSVNEGRRFIAEYAAENPILSVPEKRLRKFGEVKISLNGAYFRYEKELPDVVRGPDFSASAGELVCILGGNGTGKTTTLKLLAGLKKPYRGEVRTNGRVCLLPQDPQTLFVGKTVYSDLADALSDSPLSKEQRNERIAQTLSLCRLNGLEERHPYDLSGGEMQRAALAKLLLLDPEILLLDEPTKGLDAEFKVELADILRVLLGSGVCVVMVSHDVEFCAEYADRCALFFDGAIAAEGEPRGFFAGNSFYTTAANRISRGIIPDAVTVEDVAAALGGKIPETKKSAPAVYGGDVGQIPEKPKRKTPLWRKICAAVCGAAAISAYFYALNTEDFNGMLGQNGVTALGMKQLCVYGIVVFSLILAALFLGNGDREKIAELPKQVRKRLPKRTVAAVAFIIFLIPATLYLGLVFLDSRQYYITALAVLLECMLPFFMVFEGRKPKARELVIISVLCALGIAGRAAFFMLPEFKPVLAVVIIAGAAFGGETGFLVGAVTMLVSNMMFAQGPWTPWQMFAAGIIGFLAGLLCEKGILRRTRLPLCIFGAVSAIVIYGGIMNPVSALIWGAESLNFNMILGYYLTGLPMDCIHAAATAIFLWFLAEPMLDKLGRVKVKYGLAE